MIRKSNIGGINTDLAFRAPRVLPRDSKIFACVANGSVEMVRDMIVKGEASIYDVDDRGTSLLCASQFPPDRVTLTFSASRYIWRRAGL
jgi:hypothetical protein